MLVFLGPQFISKPLVIIFSLTDMSIERSAPSKRIMRQANKFLFLDEDLELALEAFS